MEDEEDNDGDDKTPYQLKQPPSLAKRRATAVTNADVVRRPDNTPSRFLLFHMSMLKSLYKSTEESVPYDDADADHDRTSSPPASFPPDDDKEEEEATPLPSNQLPNHLIWQSMEDFLQQRARILEARREAKDSKDIHQAARDFLKSGVTQRGVGGEQQEPHRTTVAAAVDSPTTVTARAATTTTTTSPYATWSPHTKAAPTGLPSQSATQTSTRNPFRLVSLLLQKGAATVQNRYQESASPFNALDSFVEEQMNELTREADALQEALGRSTRLLRQHLVESPRTPVRGLPQDTEERRSQLAAAQTKLQLWTLLHKDLRETIRVE
jgi:hypothetical protein